MRNHCQKAKVYQGSLQEPFLFFISINDVLNTLRKADDAALTKNQSISKCFLRRKKLAEQQKNFRFVWDLTHPDFSYFQILKKNSGVFKVT